MNASTIASPDALAYLRLSRTAGLGPILINRLVAHAGHVQSACELPASEWAAALCVTVERAGAFKSAFARVNIDEILADCDRLALRIICPTDEPWPPGLRPIPDPPPILFLRGELLRDDTLAVAIVGARQCTLYGREQAEKFARGLAQAGMTVVSGGARGIDTAAHYGALRAGGRTIVVSGCGLNHCYPPENHELYDEIVKCCRGCIISEMPPGEPPLPKNFPPRNRIIAALSLGTLVVEANLRSGSMITARLAAEDYGREVFAVPGRVDSPASSGTHHLIRSGGAELVESAGDIVESLGLLTAESASDDAVGPGAVAAKSAPAPVSVRPSGRSSGSSVSASPRGVSPAAATESEPQELLFSAPQEKILAAIGNGSDSGLDELCQHTSLPASVVMAELTMLELRGVIRRTPRQTFEKT